MNRSTLRVPNPNRSGGLAHILVIVPDDAIRAHVSLALSDIDGIEAHYVANAHEAIRQIQQSVPAAILADVSLPDLDGFKLCKLLRLPLVSRSEQIPVILISSAYRDVLAEHVARKAHAFAFLKLPSEADLVGRTVELALHRLLPNAHDHQVLGHKGNVQIVCSDDAFGHTISTALELDGWRCERQRNVEDMAAGWHANSTQVAFVEIPARGSIKWPAGLNIASYDHPVIVAMIRRPEAERVIELMEHGVDEYLVIPCDPSSIVDACREARVKYNFRSMYNEFDTQMVKLKSISDYLELVINNSHEAIFTCDPIGVVKLWNKGAERVYGYAAEEIIGKNVDDHLDPPGFTRKSPSVMRLLQQRGSMMDPEVQRVRKNGEEFPVSATYTLLKDLHGEMLGFSVIERDVTPIKQLENEKIKSARLRAITQTAVTANDHINTPLGIILGYAQFLELKLAGADQQDRAALEVIQQQVHKIKGIMNKLKLISDPIVKNYSIEGVTMLDLSKSQLSNETSN